MWNMICGVVVYDLQAASRHDSFDQRVLGCIERTLVGGTRVMKMSNYTAAALEDEGVSLQRSVLSVKAVFLPESFVVRINLHKRGLMLVRGNSEPVGDIELDPALIDLLG
jgi:hypothetical protein